MLEYLGHTAIAAPGASEGLHLLEANEPVDLVLTNLVMPGMSGWEVIRAIRTQWPHLQVGVISGAAQALAERRESVDLVVTKPTTFEKLRAAIGALSETDRGPSPL
jgi:CheY-like chemotaxis protein